MDNAEWQHAKMIGVGPETSKSQEQRIRALEIQIHTLTQTLSYVMEVTKPLVELAQQAQQHIEMENRPVEVQILRG